MPVHTPVRRGRLSRLGTAGLVAATLALGGTIAGCGTDDVIVVSTGSTPTTVAEHVTVSDAWVKAAPSGMTAAFATLSNHGDTTARLESVTTDLAGKVELHETVSDGSGGMTMRPKEGGFTIPAGDSHELAPGGDHIMMMELTGALRPGETVDLLLRFDDGSSETVAALVKDFSGAEEKYSDMAGMEGPSDGAS